MSIPVITASASSKVILFGEHAVVYGQPAIAVPVSSLRASALVQPAAEPGLTIVAQDLQKTIHLYNDSQSEDDALAYTARSVLDYLAHDIPDLMIVVQSQIPIASGLGSGAAVATALARALAAALNKSLDNEALNRLIYEVEKIHHGTPSGIDNTVIVHEQPVYFVRGRDIERIRIAKPFTVLIADSGKSALTRTVVGDVRKLYDADSIRIQRILDAIGSISAQARQHMIEGDIARLGKLMVENHTLLRELTVSSPELDRLVQAALDAGALGAKLSGGGRGGNMIALVGDRDISSVKTALLSAGAQRVIETIVG